MKRLTSFLLFSALALLAEAQPQIKLVDFATGFSRPVDIAHCGDSRLFVVEQAGKIWALDSLGNRLGGGQPFLDIDPRVNSNGNEQGLLGLAFHPDYAQNGLFFVHYTDNSGDTQVSRFRRDTLDANRADPNSEKKLLFFDQPYSNHNGGSLKFGPDGMLYIGIGDGGSAGDPQANGQKKNTLLAKILRIDVDGGDPYAVPADNPFVNDAAWRPEIWHTGLRNPWRISFDRLTGDLWIGDVGQNAREEIDFQAVGVGGINYGWRCYEGNNSYNTSGCQPQNAYTGPVFDYANPSIGCSVTGGFVYRGSKYSDIFGTYLFADYCSGRIWGITRTANGGFSGKELANLTDYQYSAFGEGRDGELYVAQLAAGKISRLTELCSAFQIQLVGDTAVCPESFSGILKVLNTGTSQAATYAWSNGKTDSLNVYLNPGIYTVTATDANGCKRIATREIKTLGAGQPLITCVGQPNLCGQDTLMLTTAPAPVGIGFQWFMNNLPIDTAQYNFLTVRQPGGYTVQLLGDTICPVAPSPLFEVTQSQPPVLTVPSQSIAHVAGNAIASVQWQNNQNNTWLDIPGETNDTLFNLLGWGLCRAVVTDSAGCTFTTDPFLVESASQPAEVSSFALRPNPTSGKFLVEMELKKAFSGQFTLTDAQRRTLFTEKFAGETVRQSLDLSSLPAGTYYLNVQLSNGSSFVRAVVRL